MANWVFQNSIFVEEEKATLSFKDLAFQRGYGIFDFFRLRGYEPLFLEEHLDRFFFSAEGMRLPVPLSRNEIKAAVAELIARNGLPDTGVRLSLSGGCADDGFNIGQPALLLSQHSFAPPTKAQVENGIRLYSYQHQRQLPHIKSIDYLMAVWLQPMREAAGADDILYQQNGFITESPRSNFFIVTENNTVVTPAENVLAGITRKKVLQLAREHFTVEERAVSMDEMRKAKEAFITSTTKQILPVAQIDDVVFPEPRTAHHLLRLFQSACSQS